MLAHRLLLPALLLALSTPAAAQSDVPAALRSLKPHQIIEAVMAERERSAFTDTQVQWLDSLHTAIRKEPHRYEGPAPGIYQYRMRPMVSRSRAYADAISILTPEQRAQVEARFNDPKYRASTGTPRPQTAAKQSEEPLSHHAAGAKPTQQSSKVAETAKDPLRHHSGKAPPAAEGDTGTLANPLTHQR